MDADLILAQPLGELSIDRKPRFKMLSTILGAPKPEPAPEPAPAPVSTLKIPKPLLAWISKLTSQSGQHYILSKLPDGKVSIKTDDGKPSDQLKEDGKFQIEIVLDDETEMIELLKTMKGAGQYKGYAVNQYLRERDKARTLKRVEEFNKRAAEEKIRLDKEYAKRPEEEYLKAYLDFGESFLKDTSVAKRVEHTKTYIYAESKATYPYSYSIQPERMVTIKKHLARFGNVEVQLEAISQVIGILIKNDDNTIAKLSPKEAMEVAVAVIRLRQIELKN